MTALQHAFAALAASGRGAEGRARHGLVTAVDPATHSVKVAIQPEGVVSGWIPDPGLACAGLRICCPAEVGTQVLVVPVEGDAEHPVIVGRLFDTTMIPPSSPATGRPVAAGEIGLFLQDGTYFHVTAGTIFMKGTLSVTGAIRATGDVIGANVSLAQHVHGGVTPGNGFSAAPRS